MSSKRSITLWDLVDPSLIGSAEVDQTSEAEIVQAETPSSRPKPLLLALDLFSAFFWIYVLIKVFVGDPDTLIVQRWLPSLTWLVDYRFLVLLGLALVVAAVTRKTYLLAFAYVAFYPLVVLVWKIPKWIYGRRSWNLAIGFLHVISSWLLGLRFTMAMVFSAVLSAVLVTSHTDVSQVLALIIVAGMLATGVYRMVTRSVGPNRFIRGQQQMISRAIESSFVSNNFNVDDLPAKGEVERFSKPQLDLFLSRVSSVAIAQKATYFWAYRMEEYRKSPAALLSSATSVLWVLVLGVYCFSVANLATYNLQSSEFTYQRAPDFLRFAYYSFSALYVNEISGLTPDGTGAVILKILAALFGAVFVLMFAITFIVSYRQSRDDTAAKQMIDQMRAQARGLDKQMRLSYDVSVDEAIRRLQELQHGLIGIVAFFSRNMPGDTAG